jgi:hypothetical protein
MKPPISLCAVALCLMSAAPGVHGQTATVGNSSTKPFGYDVTQEVTVNGTVSAVVAKAPKGMLNGSHLLISTSSGAMDVSLGGFGLIGKDAVAVEIGKNIEVVGVIKALNSKEVLLARTVKVGEQVYFIRTKYGVLLSPLARERVADRTARDGGAQ